jgi:type IV pilus assembly protein PilV
MASVVQKKAPHDRGFTLVEVMVALLVLSIGLLGVGKLVLFSARSNDSAYQRSQATALAYAMLDYMRANKVGATAGSYNTAAVSGVGNPGVNCNQAAPCANALLAQYDLYTWQQELRRALGPTADGSIAIVTSLDPVTLATYMSTTVVVQWNDTVAQQSFGAPAGNVAVTLQTVL